MATGNRDRIKGKIDEMKGRAKKAWGEMTNNPARKAEGEMDKAKGKAEEVKGDIKNAFDPEHH
jgi:uncharacterized protein YjbJ (UPF0337 family)